MLKVFYSGQKHLFIDPFCCDAYALSVSIKEIKTIIKDMLINEEIPEYFNR